MKKTLSLLIVALLGVVGVTMAQNTYTATFQNKAGWEHVYAYAWSGDGDNVQKFLGEWPGTQLTAANGLYTVSITADAAPEKIIFNNGNDQQTADLVFENGALYNAQGRLGVIPEGTYYVMNAAFDEPQLLMAAGHNWGTKGIVNERGLDFKFTYNQSNNSYDIDSRVSNGGNNHFLSNSLWMDGPSYGWTIEVGEDGETYTISGTFDGVKKYIAVDGNQELYITDNADEPTTKWKLIAKDVHENAIKAEGLAAMQAATVEAPADATFLIKTPDFNRNDLRNEENWTIVAGNKNLKGGGDNGNGCAESYHSAFTLSQVLADAPKGVYSMTAQGYYRQDGNNTEDLPVFYANDETGVFPVHTGNEGNMTEAGAAFAQGNYTIEPIFVQVTEAGQLTIGAKGTATSQWVIWDNFQLTYYGDVTIVEAKLAAFVNAYKEALAAAEAYQSIDMFDEDKAALNTAISDNTLDLTGDVTEEQLTTATTNLNNAAAAAATAALKYTTYTNATALINGGENVDLTSVIVNPSFEQGTNGWTIVGGLGPQSNTSFGKTGNYYLEYWQPNGTKSVEQTVGYLPAGLYKMTVRAKARGVTSAKVFAGGIDKAVTVEDAENEYTVDFALDEKTDAVIGFEGVGTGAGSSWLALDNFRLTFVGGLPDELTAVTGKMNKDVAAAQAAAIENYANAKTVANYNAAAAAIAAAQTSANAYAAAIANLDKVKAEIDAELANTNVYTQASYDAVITDNYSKYEAGELTDTEASSLANAVSGTSATGWRAANLIDNILLSAWDTNPDFVDAPYYINTWSVEGASDGTDFKVPFFEYYANANGALTEKTMTATMTGLEPGTYEVSAWVRVATVENAGEADGYGITLQLNDGQAVNVCDGDVKVAGANSNQRIHGNFTAVGTVGDDGVLNIKFNVAADNNIHWLSFKNVKYVKKTNTDSPDYYLVGTFNNWTASDNYKLTLNENAAEGVVEYMITLDIPANSEMKVNDTNGVWYPAGNNFLVNTEGNYTVYFRPNADGDEFWYEGCIYCYYNGEPTGISNVKTAVLNGAQIYNLNGQRLTKAQKGLNIVGGKKVVVK